MEDNRSNVVVKLRDTGVGLAADQLIPIFEMFTRLDRSLEKSQGGLGIGLTLVKRLVELHNGTVTVTGEGLGEGSEVVVRLPVMRDTIQPIVAPAVGNLLAATTSLRILIVDDNRDAADTLAEMLQVLGNVTRSAYDGQQGLNVASTFRPHVILHDVGMPNLNGYDACRLPRQHLWGRNMVLIALTGWGQEKDRILSREAGFDYHMVKPVEAQTLTSLLVGVKTGSPHE